MVGKDGVPNRGRGSRRPSRRARGRGFPVIDKTSTTDAEDEARKKAERSETAKHKREEQQRQDLQHWKQLVEEATRVAAELDIDILEQQITTAEMFKGMTTLQGEDDMPPLHDEPELDIDEGDPMETDIQQDQQQQLHAPTTKPTRLKYPSFDGMTKEEILHAKLVAQATAIESQTKFSDEDPIQLKMFEYPPAPTRIRPIVELDIDMALELSPDADLDSEALVREKATAEEFVQLTKGRPKSKNSKDPPLPNAGIIALSSLWIKNNGGRAKYQELAKSFKLMFIGIPTSVRKALEPHGVLEIPPSTYMLHRWTALLPGAAIKKREIEVSTKTLQAGLPTQDCPFIPGYYIDKLELVKLFFKNPVIRKAVYTGRQRLVDKMRNIQDCRIYGESAMVLGGNMIFYPEQGSGLGPVPSIGSDEPMLPGDVVYYSGLYGRTRVGRIRQIVEDHRSGCKKPGTVLLVVENVVRVSNLVSDNHITKDVYTDLITNGFDSHGKQVVPLPDDFVLCENPVFYVPVSRIRYRIQAIYVDGHEEVSSLNSRQRPDVMRIRYILRTLHRFSIRTAVHRHHLRAEMEIAHYVGGCDRFIEDFVYNKRGKPYLMLTMMFIDGFGLYQMGTAIYFTMLGKYNMEIELGLTKC